MSAPNSTKPQCKCFLCKALQTAPQLPPPPPQNPTTQSSELPANIELSKWTMKYRFWQSSLSSTFSPDLNGNEWKTQEEEEEERRERLLGIGKPWEEGALRSGWERVKSGLVGRIMEREKMDKEREGKEGDEVRLLEESEEFILLGESDDEDEDEDRDGDVDVDEGEGESTSGAVRRVALDSLVELRRSNTKSSIPIRKKKEEHSKPVGSKKVRRQSLIPVLRKYLP